MASACEPLARGMLRRLEAAAGGASGEEADARIERTVLDAAEGTTLLYMPSAGPSLEPSFRIAPFMKRRTRRKFLGLCRGERRHTARATAFASPLKVES